MGRLLRSRPDHVPAHELHRAGSTALRGAAREVQIERNSEGGAPRSGEVVAAHEVTLLLRRLRDGDDTAVERLMPMVHAELRRIARAHLRHERSWHTLQATELAHEAYLRLARVEHDDWRDRAHFFGVASGIMRRILVDHARKRAAVRRGGGAAHVPLDEATATDEKKPEELIALDEALSRLGALDPRQERIVELRFFGGLDVMETAAVLRVSARTVKREWSVARAWLRAELGR